MNFFSLKHSDSNLLGFYCLCLCYVTPCSKKFPETKTLLVLFLIDEEKKLHLIKVCPHLVADRVKVLIQVESKWVWIWLQGQIHPSLNKLPQSTYYKAYSNHRISLPLLLLTHSHLNDFQSCGSWKYLKLNSWVTSVAKLLTHCKDGKADVCGNGCLLNYLRIKSNPEKKKKSRMNEPIRSVKHRSKISW